MIDIKEGDVLVSGTNEYPVRAVLYYEKADWNTKSFAHMATKTVSTKRNPTVDASGKRGTLTTSLTGLKATPLDPADQEIIQRLALESPVQLLETFIADSAGFVQLIVEDLKHK